VPRRLRIAAWLPRVPSCACCCLRETVESLEDFGLTVAHGFGQVMEAVLHLRPQHVVTLIETNFESLQVSFVAGMLRSSITVPSLR
jgi:hypothetical protein